MPAHTISSFQSLAVQHISYTIFVTQAVSFRWDTMFGILYILKIRIFLISYGEISEMIALGLRLNANARMEENPVYDGRVCAL